MGGVMAPLKGMIRGATSGMKEGAAEYKKSLEKPSEETKTETVEGSESKRLIKAKKRGRASTVLSSSSGITDEAITSKKTLLGS